MTNPAPWIDDVKYAPFFRSFYQVSQTLSDKDRLALYDAVNQFCFEGTYPCFSSMDTDSPELLDTCFTVMAPIMESTLKKMAAGSKGGRPKKS